MRTSSPYGSPDDHIHKTGGRTIELFIPFEFNGKMVEAITFAPFRLGHTLGWNQGEWKGMMELMVGLAGVDKAVLHELRYPDADRVMETFMAMLPPEVREDVINNRIPLKAEPDEPEEPRVTNGGGGEPQFTPIQGPGVPLPEAGFDLSEEP